MRKIYLACCIQFILSTCIIAQDKDFEGIITYKTDYSANPDTAKVHQLNLLFGDSLRVYFRGNLYKQHYTNSRWIQEVTYLPSYNKYFMVFQKFDTLYQVDCSKADDSYTVTVDPGDRKKIMGYDCIKLVMQGEKTKKTYYFAPELSLINVDYSRHKIGGYDLFMENARSVYLYLRVENQAGVQEFKAVKIEKRALPNSVFELLPLPKK